MENGNIQSFVSCKISHLENRNFSKTSIFFLKNKLNFPMISIQKSHSNCLKKEQKKQPNTNSYYTILPNNKTNLISLYLKCKSQLLVFDDLCDNSITLNKKYFHMSIKYNLMNRTGLLLTDFY